jgi:hypothetical protein
MSVSLSAIRDRIDLYEKLMRLDKPINVLGVARVV